jgi:PAS domain S-box-containing protein
MIELDNISILIGFVISLLLAAGVIIIGKILYRLKKSEQRITQSEERFKSMFNSSGDLIYLTDLEGNIIEINQSACLTLSYSKAELLKKNISDIRSIKNIDETKEDLRIIAYQNKYTFETEYLTKIGTKIPVETTGKLTELNKKKYILFVSRDISERKELEKKLRGTVIITEEKERERFAKDLHDGLGPLLSTIKLYINELGEEDIDPEEKKNFVKYTNELIDDAISSARNISNNITPQTISKYGFVKAIESFIKKVNKSDKIEITFKSQDIKERFEQTIELILFRVTSELINNTIKHANADNIIIIIEEINNSIILSYKDDGIGFNVDEALEKSPDGIGLMNIISRVQSINGYCNFYNEEGKGTNIKIKIEL